MGIFDFFRKKEHKPSTAELLRNRQFNDKQDELIEHGFPKGEFMLSIENIENNENGIYVSGIIQAGNIKTGDTLTYNGFKTFNVKELKIGDTIVDDARKDENISILLENRSSSEVEIGGVLKK